jgi:hypothetical protein
VGTGGEFGFEITVSDKAIEGHVPVREALPAAIQRVAHVLDAAERLALV